MSARRFYRRAVTGARLTSFTVNVKETDLWIAVTSSTYKDLLSSQVEAQVWQLRCQLETYIAEYPYFKQAHQPCLAETGAPQIVRSMVAAAVRTGVGPMAAVAGAFAEAVGFSLLNNAPEVIVENGGDIFLRTTEPIQVGIYAGASPLSGRVALQVKPHQTPLGICTSSATVGPSLSFGCADAAVAISSSTTLADAAATALGNLVKKADDLEKILEYAQKMEGVVGALLICGDRIAAWGDVELKKI